MSEQTYEPVTKAGRARLIAEASAEAAVAGIAVEAQKNLVVLAAEVAHEVNRAYCEAIGDTSQVPWASAEEWQKESAIEGAQKIADGEITSPGDSHRSWMAHKLADGWTHGEEKDPEAKTHPCLVPFEELPAEQQIKDFLFLGTVKTILARA